MGYNISEVTGATGSGTSNLNVWTFDVNLDGTGITTVSGDFDEVPIGGGSASEADGGYTFSVTSGGEYGDLTFDGATGQFTFTIDLAEVYGSGSDQTVVISVTGTDSDGSDNDTININMTICVARGTLIATAQGLVAVEELRVGDMVQTLDGPTQPVRWIGCSRLSEADLGADPSLRPIRIAAGAFGENRPCRDLTVSPQHRILVDDWRAELFFGTQEVLVPAKGLVNDTSIRICHDAQGVDYFHVLFDHHEIMLTEGLATESFHPGDHTLRGFDDAVRAELFKLLPELLLDKSAVRTARMALRPWESTLLRECVSTRGTATDGRIIA